MSRTIALLKLATNTSPNFSSLSHERTHSANAILNNVWHCRISGNLWNNVAIFAWLNIGGEDSSNGFL